MFHPARNIRVLAPIVLAVTGLFVGCQGEDTRLFEEDGVWSLTDYDFNGEGLTSVSAARANAFLLKFDSGPNIVAAATCVDAEGKRRPSDSLCHMDGGSVWTCDCFKYEYEDDWMRWIKFNPGMPPGSVPPPGDPASGGSTMVNVALPAETKATAMFSPLPTDLFGSQNELSRFIFQKKAATLWMNPGTPPNMPPACDSCF